MKKPSLQVLYFNTTHFREVDPDKKNVYRLCTHVKHEYLPEIQGHFSKKDPEGHVKNIYFDPSFIYYFQNIQLIHFEMQYEFLNFFIF